MLNPPHPGAFVRTEVIEPLGLTVGAAAAVLGVSRPALSSFLNGRSALSSTMALRTEKAFGVKMDTLMRMQLSYDIARAREREGEVQVTRYRSVTACPVRCGGRVRGLGSRWPMPWQNRRGPRNPGVSSGVDLGAALEMMVAVQESIRLENFPLASRDNSTPLGWPQE